MKNTDGGNWNFFCKDLGVTIILEEGHGCFFLGPLLSSWVTCGCNGVTAHKIIRAEAPGKEVKGPSPRLLLPPDLSRKG